MPATRYACVCGTVVPSQACEGSGVSAPQGVWGAKIDKDHFGQFDLCGRVGRRRPCWCRGNRRHSAVPEPVSVSYALLTYASLPHAVPMDTMIAHSHEGG